MLLLLLLLLLRHFEKLCGLDHLLRKACRCGALHAKRPKTGSRFDGKEHRHLAVALPISAGGDVCGDGGCDGGGGGRDSGCLGVMG